MNHNRMKQILQENIEVSGLVEERLNKAYEQIREKKDKEEYIKKKKWRKAVVAAAVICAAGGLSMGTAFAFGRVPKGIQEIFGNETRKSTQLHTEKVYSSKAFKSGCAIVEIPGTEYVPLDEAMASRFLDGFVLEEPVVKQIGDYTLTMESYVTDGQAFCVYLTLECPDGIEVIEEDEYINRVLGLQFSQDADLRFQFKAGAGEETQYGSYVYMYLDEEKSTDEKYHIYGYGVWYDLYDYMILADKEVENPYIDITYYSQDKSDVSADVSEIIEEKVPFSTAKVLGRKTVEEDGDIILIYSPISMYINERKFAEFWENISEEVIQYIEIIYQDGTSYLVYDKGKMDNTGAAIVDIGSDEHESMLGLTFNRIVDVDNIAQIKVNNRCFKVTE